MNWKTFCICGLTGWCMEIIFTSFGALLQGDVRLLGRTSIWMFPIYGMASLIGLIYKKIEYWPVLLRGLLYSCGIMLGEFLSGSFLKLFSACPWDYSDSLLHINGVVRLDYFPFWVAAGLVFERLLCLMEEKTTPAHN